MRDAQGRITQVDYPAYFGATTTPPGTHTTPPAISITVDLPTLPCVFFRTDAPHLRRQHRLLTSVDPNGNTARTSTYYADGRLETDKDALGNVTQLHVRPGDADHHDDVPGRRASSRRCSTRGGWW